MQTFGTHNLLCQWVPKFNYAFCEKLLWGLKYLTSFHLMLLILMLWLKINTDYTFTFFKPAVMLQVPFYIVFYLQSWRLLLYWLFPLTVIPFLWLHLPSFWAPFKLQHEYWRKRYTMEVYDGIVVLSGLFFSLD